MRKHWVASGAMVAFLALGVLQSASASEPDRGRGPPRGPPAEALQACQGQQEGATCSFTHDGHAMNGTCHMGPQGEPAACRPEGGPHGGHGGPGGHRAPPPEAQQACNGLQEGATCNFTHDGRAVSGTCRAGPEGGSVSCAPSRPPQEP